MNEELLIGNFDPIENETKVLIGLVNKSDMSKLAVTTEQYNGLDKSMFELDGLIIRNDDVDLIFSSSEVDAHFSDGIDDIPETDKRRKGYHGAIESDEYDGQERTQTQLDIHTETHESGCAICEAIKFGWLPSLGEISILYKNMEEFNNVAENVGATPLSLTEYWTSTQFSEEYMWSADFANKVSEFWRSKKTLMKVRPCKSAIEYNEIIN